MNLLQGKWPRLATLLAVLVAAALVFLAWERYTRTPWTRDARVRADVVTLSADVSGLITRLPLSDNQPVEKGELLLSIDPARYELAVLRAERAVNVARAALGESRAAIEASQAQLRQRRSEAQRRSALQKRSMLSVEENEKAQTDVSLAQAELLRNQASLGLAQANVELAEAALQQARLDLERTQVRAPVSGYVTNLQTREGDYAHAGVPFHVNVIASATYKLIMDLLGNDFPISALTVPVHGADKTIYEGFFSLPVKHEGNDIIFSFPAHQLNRTLATANPAVFQSALTMAGESFNALLEVEMGGLRQRIELFLDSIPDQYPSLVTTAKYLRMNERTVRRRLADEGCTYRQIVDKARKERAIALLLNSSIPVDRISDILGYSETASFRHAFRRWTGQSTTEFRNSFH